MIFGKNDLTIYEKYSSEWWDPNSPRFRSLQKVTEFRIKQIDLWFGCLKGATAIDVGCGGGLLSIPLIERGAKVFGVDLSPGSLETARRASGGQGTFVEADARNLPLETSSADFVLLADVLDHIEDYPNALREARRVLKPSGLLYVNTINRTFRSWLFAIVLGEGTRLIPPGTHDHRLFITPQELEKEAKRLGLQLEAIQGEAPCIWPTIKHWAITFRATDSHAIAYSALFRAT